MNEQENIKRVMWYVFAGTKGGPTRIRIIELLVERPFNINQLSSKLKMDYKSVQHHIRMLEENRLITGSEEKKYASMYFVSQIFAQGKEAFEEIKNKVKG